MIEEMKKMWNGNFDRGVSIFQICLMGSMIIGAIIGNQFLVLFSTGVCLFGYFEPNAERYSINSFKSGKEKEVKK